MSKGDLTKSSILNHATDLASQVGLTGLSIGVLAKDLELSKSGLFAHFKSKEALQIQVLEHGAGISSMAVVRPALQQPRGEPRLRALFDGWLGWDQNGALPGGCVFVAAASELDDRPGPVRDRLVALQREWVDLLTYPSGRASRLVSCAAMSIRPSLPRISTGHAGLPSPCPAARRPCGGVTRSPRVRHPARRRAGLTSGAPP